MTPRKSSRSPLRRILRLSLRWGALATLAAGVAVSAVELGWLEQPRPWTQATGWDRVPPALRVGLTTDPLWEATRDGDAPTLRWLGHSGFVLRWRGATVLLDPNLSPWVTVAKRRLETSIAPEEIAPVDAVLISHAHFDHLDRSTLDRLGEVGAVLTPRGSERYLSDSPHAAVTRSVEVWHSERIGPIEVTAVPAAHHGNRMHPLQSRIDAVGWVLRAPDGRGGVDALYFAGDTGPSNDFDAIRDRFHPRVAILPVGAFSPSWPIGLYHTSPEQAAAIGRRLGVELVVPCHFGTFRLSLDRHDSALPRFARAADELGLRWRFPALATAPPPAHALPTGEEPTT